MPFEFFSSLTGQSGRSFADTLKRVLQTSSQRNRKAARRLRLEGLEYRALLCADCPDHVLIAPVITSEVPLGPNLPASTTSTGNAPITSQSMEMEHGADYVEITATQIITHVETFPRFAANPTNTAIRGGLWSNASTWSAGRAPVSGDRVNIPQGVSVTYASISNNNIDALEISGTLTFATNQNTRLKAGDIQVLPTGTLRIGSAASPVAAGFTAELIIADKPLSVGTVANPGVDPKQLGTALIVLGTLDIHGSAKDRTWVRLAAEPRAGDTSVLLEQPVTGWRAGETLIFPDTRQPTSSYINPFFENRFIDVLTSQHEEVTISRIEGNRVFLTRALQFDHLGARNPAGQLELLPHVAVLDRNVVIRSENPMGTRGHTMFHGRANIDVEYARFKDLGRTDAMRPLNNTVLTNGQVTAIGTNQIARYPIHLHHLLGPENPTNTGYQFKLIGNTVDHSRKWAITIHNASYGLIQDNVMYDAQGTGFMAEDGSEIENVIDRNFTMRISGIQDEGTNGPSGTAANDLARAGTGFWFRRSGNIVTGNVAADSVFAGYAFNGYHLWNDVVVPAFRGADKTMPGEGVMYKVNPSGVFTNNEAYGMSRHGIWAVYLNGPNGAENHPTNVFKDIRLWNSSLVSGVEAYHTAGLEFDNLLLLNGSNPTDRPDTGARGLNFSNYEDMGLVIKNSRVEGFLIGIDAPRADASQPGQARPTIVRDTTLNNYINVQVQPILDESSQGGNALELRNVRFFRSANVPVGTPQFAGPSYNVVMRYEPEKANLTRPSTVRIYDYNGVSGQNFQVYYKEQRPNFIMPQTTAASLWGRSSYQVGSPEAGLTNQQNMEKYGLATFGAIAPSLNDTARPEIFGYTGAISSPAATKVSFATPWFGAAMTEVTEPVRIRHNLNGELPAGSKVFFKLDGVREFDVVDGGVYQVGEGPHLITAYIGDEVTGRKIAGTDESSVAFNIADDWVYPQVDIVDVADPRSQPVNDMTIRYTHSMRSVDIGDLTLSRDGGPNLLTAAQTLTQVDSYTWRLNNLSSITRLPGKYTLYVADRSAVSIVGGYTLASPAAETFSVGNIVGRHVFYNRSAFDGDNPAANAADEQAIAPDKFALLPGETATFANYTSYTRGINGLIVDVRNLAGNPTAGDFIFKAGNTSNPTSWPLVSVTPTVTIRRGQGAQGSDRVTIVFPDNSIVNQWLQVTVRVTDHTGLIAPDTFYFGNAVGDTGNSTLNTQVSAADEIFARNTPKTLVNPALITDRADFNRDLTVSAVDQIIARNSRTTFSNMLILLQAPPLNPFSGVLMPNPIVESTGFAESNLPTMRGITFAGSEAQGSPTVVQQRVATVFSNKSLLTDAAFADETAFVWERHRVDKTLFELIG